MVLIGIGKAIAQRFASREIVNAVGTIKSVEENLQKN
jgi:hypothetical protein